MTRGAALAALGRPAEALAAFEKVRAIAPTNAMALVDIGTVRLGARDYARAREAFEAALAMNPGLPRAHNGLGVIEAETGRPDAAIERWQRAAALDPRTIRRSSTWVRRCVTRGARREAKAYLEAYLRLAPKALEARDIARVRAWLGGQEGPLTGDATVPA